MSDSGKRRALGRGLSALIPQATEPQAIPSERELRVDEISPSPWQPRRRFEQVALTELTESVREHGVLQPLLVRKTDAGYELIAGERRLRAAREAGLEKVPVVVRGRSDQESLEIGLIENLQREDLGPLEEAMGYRRLVDEFGLTQDAVAKRVGKSRPAVANALRLLTLPDPVCEEIRTGHLSAGHARALLVLSSSSEQIQLAREAVRRALSVRQLEAVVRLRANARPKRTPAPDLHVADMERQLSQSLGTRVRLTGKGTKGQIVIEYFSPEERERLIAQLR